MGEPIQSQFVELDKAQNLCKELKAKTYLSGPFGRDYLDAKKFSKDNIDIIYHDYSHPKYEQLGDTFIPYLSSLDLLFNHGNASLNILNKKLF